MERRSIALTLLVMTASTGLPGCATWRSVENAQTCHPYLYSGTRLDLAALRGESTRRFHAEAPAQPALDLPLSVVGDTLILPLTINAALIDALKCRR